MFRGRGAAVVAVALVAMSTGAQAAHAAERDRSCPWVLEPTFDRENILFPEVTTRYLGAVAPVPPGGGSVVIHGEFPHARYMSLQTYTGTLQSMSVLRDEQIEPDPGSTNPFRRGADRTAKRRSYTVRIVAGKPPAGPRPANTLYNTMADGSQSGNGLAYRIYVSDKGSGPFGGVPAPRIAFRPASGAEIATPTCPDPIPDTTGVSGLVAAQGTDAPLAGPGVLAFRRPRFNRYVNAPTSYALAATDNEFLNGLSPALTQATGKLPSGLGENADNKYVAAYLTNEFGPVLALRGALPTTPRTRDGRRRMGTGQLRFWSMCTGGQATQTWGCVIDEDLPLARGRRYTIVVSTPGARPRNATARCGVAWLPYGPSPKSIAIMRNMLPAPTFDQAVQNAAVGSEEKTLGKYYPVGTYSSKAAFEGRGCPVR